MFGPIFSRVVVAEAVERYQDHVRLGLLRGRIWPVIDSDHLGQALGG